MIDKQFVMEGGARMKIPLNLGQNGQQSSKAAQARALEHDILAAKKGDWNAKSNLIRTFMPLITSLAEKRSSDVANVNKYIEAGKNGLVTAAKKYKQSLGPENFQVFALDFLEASMDRVGRRGGILSRFFGPKT